MVKDKQYKKLVLVFDIENTQNSYARCLRIINRFENEVLNFSMKAVDFYLRAKSIPESDFSFSVNQIGNEPNDKMENMINPGEYARIPVHPDIEKQFFIDAVNDWHNNKEKLKRPHYHIRIKFNYDSQSRCYKDIENLQFLAMLIQQIYITCFNNDFAQEKLKERLSVFLIPYTGTSFRFAGEDTNADTTLYNLASHYLRLIANMHKGVIYGNSLPNTVEAVNFKEHTRDICSFPLLYLGNTEQNNYNKLFNTSEMVTKNIIEQGFTYETNNIRPFNMAADENPHTAIADLILDETRERILTFFASLTKTGINNNMSRADILNAGRKRIKKFINTITMAAEKCDRFTFALFGCLLFANRDDSDESIIDIINTTMELARELGDGVRQIVQNSIQHSQYKICYISFFRAKNTNPLYEYKEQLCIRVTDLHQQKTITQTFIEKIRKEKILRKNNLNENDLFEDENKYLSDKDISIKGLIGEFGSEKNDDVLKAWYNFRKKDSAAHIGLSIFNNTLKRCQCIELQIISNTSPKLEDNNEYTYNAYNVDHAIGNIFERPERNIPGTQIAFSIPIKKMRDSLPVNLVQLANSNAFTEGHAAFAHFLEYKAYEKDWKNILSNSDDNINLLYNLQITDAESKLISQDKWKQFWLKLMKSGKKQEIHLYDIDAMPSNSKDTTSLAGFLKERDQCEIFIKGFMAAASVYRIEKTIYESEYYPSCFYFENLPEHFIDILQEVSISLSLIDFSLNLQVFFSCKKTYNEEDGDNQPRQLLVMGNCAGHAIQNAYIMSLEHGEEGPNISYYNRSSQMLLPYRGILKQQQSDTQRIITKPNDNQLYNLKISDENKPQYVCPFTIFKRLKTNGIPQYFTQIEKIANRNLVNNGGYKFSEIHIRLGNKVHADSFYEMAFLFYRTSVANRIAFYILQKIKDDLSKVKDTIVFYGYASYSQALIFSLKEMLKEYFKKKNIKNEVHYASYQYNLQTEFDYSDNIEKSADIIKIFSTLEKQKGEPIISTSVVQIVPIASTLTTFDKMRAEYLKDRESKEEPFEKSKIIKNYNVFLVRDKKGNKAKCSKIEKDLWININPKNRVVEVNTDKLKELKFASKISYIFSGTSNWSRPTECNQCFPEDVLKEDPLVETDPTSTVPTFQVYQAESLPENNFDNISVENISRLEKLNSYVYYGHFIRGRNHYQYYIDTQRYLSNNKIKQQIIDWLIYERRNDDKRTCSEDKMTSVLNIIFSPEHNTNVGFSQLVNTYFFNGTAEIVSVNVDKQFRSNFKCEHDALKQTIKRLLYDNEDINKGLPVRFFFADDGIVSGGSYHRAKNLLMSLIPNKYIKYYSGYIFSKCFVLVNRLSLATREAYVADPQNNFLSFCHINISNMRKQGDSCVGCKLEREAKHLFKRSSTRSLANYWAKKTGDYNPVMFDNTDEIKKYSGWKAFVRMLITHVIENLIRKLNVSEEKTKEKTEKKIEEKIKELIYFILYKSSEPLNCDRDDNGTIIDIKENKETALIKIAFDALKDEYNKNELKIIYLLEYTIKILSRPFLAYNINLKKPILRIIINICESVLNEKYMDSSGIGKEIINYYMALDLQGLLLLDFVQNCLFEALADMKSTYLLRKKTLKKSFIFTKKYANMDNYISCHFYKNKKSCQYIKIEKPAVEINENDETERPCGNSRIRCFWKKYAIYINKIIDSGGDETRSLWMEYLFLCGNEHPKRQPDEKIPVKKGITLPLFESIVMNDVSDSKAVTLFNEFCMEIFLQNSRLLYDGIEKASEKTHEIDPDVNRYFFDNLNYIRKWDLSWATVNTSSAIATEENSVTIEEKEMFNILNKKKSNLQDTDQKYQDFLLGIINMIKSKYTIETEFLCVALVTQKGDTDPKEMNNLDFITDHFTSTKQKPWEIARARYIIKQRIIWALEKYVPPDKSNNIYSNSRLIEDGYCLIHPDDNIEHKDNDFFDIDSDSNNYRKPFFILRFDNIPIEHDPKLDRDIQPVEKVYLYVSFGFKPSENYKEKTVPVLIMRDILSYRNRIMHMLEEDFNSHLMQLYAHKAGENTILRHEKTVSHTLTSDDQLPTTLWNREHEIKNDDYEWLLFRNYTNTQIAKLFKRTLLLDDKNFKDPYPKFYLKDKDIDEKDNFKIPAKTFGDLWDKNDKRIALFKQIIDIQISEELITEQLITPITNNDACYFNKEYLKCVLFDILFTCARFWRKDVNFLSRINKLNEYNKDNEYNEDNEDDNNKYKNKINSNDWLRCRIIILRNKNNLVIINPVKVINNNVFDGWKQRNEQIIFQKNNPIDSFDGHMSLFTISKYISGNTREFPNFEYKLFEDLPDDWKNKIIKQWDDQLKKDKTFLYESLWFVSELPIFQGE